jgi:hypothetical protein
MQIVTISDYVKENAELLRDNAAIRRTLRDVRLFCHQLGLELDRAKARVQEAEEREQQAVSCANRAHMKYIKATLQATERTRTLDEIVDNLRQARIEGREEMREAVLDWMSQHELDPLIDQIKRLKVT